MKFKDLTGKRFERLTVIKRVENRGKHTQWLCKCDCGNEKISTSTNLISGHIKSCNCLRLEKSTDRIKALPRKTLPFGEGSCNFLKNSYFQNAKKRNLEFNLTNKEFLKLTSSNCYYCGKVPSNKIKGHRSNGEYVYNGIDRIDTKKGYTLDNCVPCCSICNYGKNAFTHDEFQNWIDNLVEFKISLR